MFRIGTRNTAFLGNVLKHIRVFNRYTQIELAKKLHLSRSYISAIEANKKKPSMEKYDG